MKVIVIGSGFSSLSSSCYLQQMGYEVTILEKNDTIGGRAQQLKKDGFTFDLGPTWYWMPDIFDSFFNDFGFSTDYFYKLEKLNPAYRVFFKKGNSIDIEDSLEKIAVLFEKEETGSGEKLKQFIAKAEENYNVAIRDLVYRPGISPLELVNFKTIQKLRSFFSTISKDVRRYFKNENLVKILEFPTLFLGAKPSLTPSFYSFMNYADFGLGTWYPKGGMYNVIKAIEQLSINLGVEILTGENVKEIKVEGKYITNVITNKDIFKADVVLSGADYHHTETLLPESSKQYSQQYWSKKIFAPSALLFYVGFDKKLKNVAHHTLFFDTDFDTHIKAIYDTPSWPKEPLFYASFPSITDADMAPKEKEAGIFLIPIACGIEDTQVLREQYFNSIVKRLEQITEQELSGSILFNESFCVKDFIERYNSYKGNAYGMANTLLQTAFLRPKLKSKKVNNLYFTGQLTVPGPGVPPSLISGKLAAELIFKYHNMNL